MFGACVDLPAENTNGIKRRPIEILKILTINVLSQSSTLRQNQLTGGRRKTGAKKAQRSLTIG